MYLILIPFPVVVSLLFAYFRPYKNNCFNIIDGLAFALVALIIYFLVYAITWHFPVQLLYGIGLIPFLYFISFILYKIVSQVSLFHACWNRIANRLRTRNENQYLLRDENIDEDLPDRIVNPHMYQPLLQATNNAVVNPQSDSQPQAGVNTLAAYGSL